ncbi:unnamed protein product [Somion occarium]|uniref:Secreted protein n=1 Tax=Somion occarium TaxID=3059160 RepID=A0ABP1EB91_9APHY
MRLRRCLAAIVLVLAYTGRWISWETPGLRSESESGIMEPRKGASDSRCGHFLVVHRCFFRHWALLHRSSSACRVGTVPLHGSGRQKWHCIRCFIFTLQLRSSVPRCLAWLQCCLYAFFRSLKFDICDRYEASRDQEGRAMTIVLGTPFSYPHAGGTQRQLQTPHILGSVSSFGHPRGRVPRAVRHWILVVSGTRRQMKSADVSCRLLPYIDQLSIRSLVTKHLAASYACGRKRLAGAAGFASTFHLHARTSTWH